jgi:hypothetical protein
MEDNNNKEILREQLKLTVLENLERIEELEKILSLNLYNYNGKKSVNLLVNFINLKLDSNWKIKKGSICRILAGKSTLLESKVIFGNSGNLLNLTISSFTVNGLIDVAMFKEQIQYWIDNPTEKTIEIIQLFY